jgi:hypothetical protein
MLPTKESIDEVIRIKEIIFFLLENQFVLVCTTDESICRRNSCFN